MTATTNSIDIHLYLWSPLRRQIVSHFKYYNAPTLTRTVTEGSRNYWAEFKPS